MFLLLLARASCCTKIGWPLCWTAMILTLTHWGRVTHICVGNLTIIVSDNGLSPYRRQAIIWTNAGILLTGPLGTNFSEILIEILAFSFKKMRLKVSSAKWRPFCLGLNVLRLFGTLNDSRLQHTLIKSAQPSIRQYGAQEVIVTVL